MDMSDSVSQAHSQTCGEAEASMAGKYFELLLLVYLSTKIYASPSPIAFPATPKNMMLSKPMNSPLLSPSSFFRRGSYCANE